MPLSQTWHALIKISANVEDFDLEPRPAALSTSSNKLSSSNHFGVAACIGATLLGSRIQGSLVMSKYCLLPKSIRHINLASQPPLNIWIATNSVVREVISGITFSFICTLDTMGPTPGCRNTEGVIQHPISVFLLKLPRDPVNSLRSRLHRSAHLSLPLHHLS